ncbi:uncharacterized protein LOC122390632 isoform X2 [Amphibalanus amphitrite]|uniref:uncharacterized protein LOC122390632 isoform X1 n=1 Tax=Amphibalanus amphitrite TaxID=1232801 RepID=UPI001C91A9A1|nr:uncharacterized protein LOC122390632 isoform X1 [Amphibalanus amphitrite]XP_043239713.1 uncharacterized protein LOC122390632 isoform X2 [Amphibalanus amphitrite]
MIKVVLLALVAAAAEALPFGFTEGVAQFRAHPGSARASYGPPSAPSGPLGGNSAEVERWLRLLGPLSTAPSNYVQDREGPSIYDDFYPSVSPQAAASSRTLWFEEFPHRRAVLNWQEKRIQQGLPVYKLLSQRPGFPFYQGN